MNGICQDSETKFSGCFLSVKYTFDLKRLSQKPDSFTRQLQKLTMPKEKRQLLAFDDSPLGFEFLLKWIKN